MNRKILGVLASMALAGLGTFLVLSYVNSAEERALADEEVVEVLVVQQTVAAGETVADIGDRVRPALIPAKVQAVGSVASLDDLGGRVAAVDLQPGEQVIASRFVEVETYEQANEPELVIPDGTVQVTVSLSPERAVGGKLHPGDLVAVFASFDPFNVETVEPGELEPFIGVTQAEDEEGVAKKTANSTHIILHKVLVTGVQLERLPQNRTSNDDESAEPGPDLAPTGNLLITVAIEPPEAEQLVFTAEHGMVWLAHETETVSETGTQIQTRGTIYR